MVKFNRKQAEAAVELAKLVPPNAQLTALLADQLEALMQLVDRTAKQAQIDARVRELSAICNVELFDDEDTSP